MHSIIRRSAWKAVPWKNGGGITHEILREGPSDAFTFRLSAAEVAADGPFSRFPGIDRILMGLTGAGFRLIRSDSTVVLMDRLNEPFCFMGEDEWRCELLGGPCLDFNVMTDRRRARSTLLVHTISSADRLVVPDRGFILAIDGGVRVDGDDLQAHDLVAFRAACAVEPLVGPIRVALIALA